MHGALGPSRVQRRQHSPHPLIQLRIQCVFALQKVVQGCLSEKIVQKILDGFPKTPDGAFFLIAADGPDARVPLTEAGPKHGTAKSVQDLKD